MEPKFVQEYVNAQFKDGRSFSITELGGDKIGIDIFTDGVLQEVYFDMEALVSLLATAYIYFSLKKIDMGDILLNAVDDRRVTYTHSENLAPSAEFLAASAPKDGQ